MLFLDEPTTGIDSKTAENLVKLLVRLAKEGGRTVVSTIHQPSSQIFGLFDELLILLRGSIIYQGKARSAIDYFGGIGYVCPELTNPADYFMQITNETGILVEEMKKKNSSQEVLNMQADLVETRFAERVQVFKKAYLESNLPQKAKEGIIHDHIELRSHSHASWLKQFWYIFTRKIQDEIRNPMEVKMKVIQAIIFSLIMMIVFNNVTSTFIKCCNNDGCSYLIVRRRPNRNPKSKRSFVLLSSDGLFPWIPWINWDM